MTVNNYKCPWDYTGTDGSGCTLEDTNSYRKPEGTQETISPASYNGYRAPGSQAVNYDRDRAVNFYHTAIPNIPLVTAVYSSRQLKAIHTSSGTAHTDLYLPNGSRSYGYIVPADSSSAIQWPEYSTTSSQTYQGWPNIIVLNDSGSPSSTVAAFSGANYSNGARGTYYVRTCNMRSDNTETCTDAEELRPYFEIKYDLRGGTGTSSTQTKYAGESKTLHGTPSKTGYKGWAAQTQDGTQCRLCNGSGGACDKDSYYAAGRSLNDQEWNVGNESWPCSSREAYVNNVNTVYLRAVWNRNPWNEVE